MITVDHVGGLTIGRDMQNSFYVQEDSQMKDHMTSPEFSCKILEIIQILKN